MSEKKIKQQKEGAKRKKAHHPPMADFESRGFELITEGVEISENWPQYELVYLRFTDAQVRTDTLEGEKGLETRVTVAIPRAAAEKLVQLQPIPKTPVRKLRGTAEKTSHRLFFHLTNPEDTFTIIPLKPSKKAGKKKKG